MFWMYNIDKLQIRDDSLTESQLYQLDPLWEELDDIKDKLYDRILLFTSIYLTPVQSRRWFLFFKLGSIKAVAETEGVSTAAVHKSLLGTRDNESSRSKIKSPIEKIEGVIQSDPLIQSCLEDIKKINEKINDIIEYY